MNIKNRLRIIFEKKILAEIGIIKNYKYFENDKLLVIYIDAMDIDNYHFSEFVPSKEAEIMESYEDIYNKYFKEYDEKGNLETPEFSSYDVYQFYHGHRWYNTHEDCIIKNISDHIRYYLEFVSLEFLAISICIDGNVSSSDGLKR